MIKHHTTHVRFSGCINGIIDTTRPCIIFVVMMVLAVAVTSRIHAQQTQPDDSHSADNNDVLTFDFYIPLDQGKISLGLLLGELFDRMSMDGQPIRENVNITIDVTASTGQGVLKMIEKTTAEVVQFDVSDDQLVVTIDRLKLRQSRERLQHSLSSLATHWYHKEQAKALELYGLKYHKADGTVVVPEAGDLPSSVILLIHGLDEPGIIWKNLVPILNKQGYAVVEFIYPNDQAVNDSARFLADNLSILRGLGVEEVDIVAHSMGGLVTRSVLADPSFYAGLNHMEGMPMIDRFIMVGTPNHGSEMARLRLAGELHEQVIRTFSGEGLLFGSVFDGSGEAKKDLLPGSQLLEWLNSQPLPKGVRITIIAGRASPVSEQKLANWVDKANQSTDGVMDKHVDQINHALSKIVNGLGDGAVTIQSTRLDGVDDHVIVEANHITMLYSIFADEDDPPAAIPVILDRLGK